MQMVAEQSLKYPLFAPLPALATRYYLQAKRKWSQGVEFRQDAARSRDLVREKKETVSVPSFHLH